jgi:hypothetical protein
MTVENTNSMMLKACLFDLDGVIVDTARYHFVAWREIAEELGFVFTEEDNEKLKGVSRIRSLEILLEIGGISLDDESKTLLAQKKNSLYLQYVLKMRPDEVLPGAREFLTDCPVCTRRCSETQSGEFPGFSRKDAGRIESGRWPEGYPTLNHTVFKYAGSARLMGKSGGCGM